jgi:hypothetical protein
VSVMAQVSQTNLNVGTAEPEDRMSDPLPDRNLTCVSDSSLWTHRP